MTQLISNRRSKYVIREKLAAAGIPSRGLSTGEAAAYVGLSERSFLAEVQAGRYPNALPLKTDRLVWDRRALDIALDKLSGLITSPLGIAGPDVGYTLNAKAMDDAIENAAF